MDVLAIPLGHVVGAIDNKVCRLEVTENVNKGILFRDTTITDGIEYAQNSGYVGDIIRGDVHVDSTTDVFKRNSKSDAEMTFNSGITGPASPVFGGSSSSNARARSPLSTNYDNIRTSLTRAETGADYHDDAYRVASLSPSSSKDHPNAAPRSTTPSKTRNDSKIQDTSSKTTIPGSNTSENYRSFVPRVTGEWLFPDYLFPEINSKPQPRGSEHSDGRLGFLNIRRHFRRITNSVNAVREPYLEEKFIKALQKYLREPDQFISGPNSNGNMEESGENSGLADSSFDKTDSLRGKGRGSDGSTGGSDGIGNHGSRMDSKQDRPSSKDSNLLNSQVYNSNIGYGSIDSLPESSRPGGKRKVMLYLHGGAYILVSAGGIRLYTYEKVKRTGEIVFVHDYTKPPYDITLEDSIKEARKSYDYLRYKKDSLCINRY